MHHVVDTQSAVVMNPSLLSGPMSVVAVPLSVLVAIVDELQLKQKLRVRQFVGNTSVLLCGVGADQLVPSHRTTSPALSYTTHEVLDVHDTAVGFPVLSIWCGMFTQPALVHSGVDQDAPFQVKA
jgi:hypothetical protein